MNLLDSRGAARCRVLVFALALAAAASNVHGEKADREKPINIEADKVTLDDNQKIGTFEGNVVLTQGTTKILANKLTLRQDKQGNQSATALGKPTTFRTKRDAVEEYVDGAAERIEYDGKSEKVELFTNATLKRSQDEVRGNYISYDSATEFYQVLGGGTQTASAGGNNTGRVHMVILPKPKAGTPQPNPAATPKPTENAAEPRK
jgi:lipopolysaccharide export system protein LptA